MEDLEQRRIAIQKLQLVRQFAAQDNQPCAVLPGLFIGAYFAVALCFLVSKNMLSELAV